MSATGQGMSETGVEHDPIAQFALWYEQACATEKPLPHAVALATATRGAYDQRSQKVQLSGGVRVEDVGSGYRFQTERTTIDTEAGIITGDSPAKGAGPLGQISASSYAITDEGTRMTFKGNVRARINTGTKQ